MSNPTRRTLLSVVAIAPLAISVSLPTPALADTSEWSAALARAKAADMAYGDASAAEEDACQLWYDACEAIRPKGLVDRKWASLDAQLHSLPLSEIEVLYEPPHVTQSGRGAVMAEAVRRYRDERETLRAAHQIAEHETTMSAASREWREAYDAAVVTPTPTIAALADKIAMIIHQTAACGELEPLLTDAQRLAGMEAQS